MLGALVGGAAGAGFLDEVSDGRRFHSESAAEANVGTEPDNDMREMRFLAVQAA